MKRVQEPSFTPPRVSFASGYVPNTAELMDQIRLCLEHRAFEKMELQWIGSELGIPGDFDIAQITWRSDY